MNWQEFIKHIIKEFRLTETSLAEIAGVTPPAINKLKNRAGSKPMANTIKNIEKNLNIIIFDTDENNITYKENEKTKKSGEIGISAPKIIGVDDIDIGLKNMDVLHYIEITDKIDTSTRKSGDIVVFDPSQNIEDDDEIIIKLVNGDTKIRKCTIEENSILYIENGRIKKIIKQDIECMYKIVGSMQLQS